jgi:tetratricopeptide (TPR) repeat protein
MTGHTRKDSTPPPEEPDVAPDETDAGLGWAAVEFVDLEPAHLRHLPRNPILDDYPGKTVAENLDHQQARTVFMAALLNRAEMDSLFWALADEASLLEPLNAAIAALEAVAQRAGFTSRGELYVAEVAPDTSVEPAELEALAAYFDAVSDPTRGELIRGRLHDFVVALDIQWPWVEVELRLAFEVSYLESAFRGVQLGIILSGGPSAPETSTAVEVGGVSIDEGETLPSALKQLDDHEEAIRAARRELEMQARPTMPMGRLRRKTRATLARDVEWYFRRKVLHEPVVSIARVAFGPAGPERRRDVRAGVQRAERVLGLTSYGYAADGTIVPLERPAGPVRAGGRKPEAEAPWEADQAKWEIKRAADDPVGLLNLCVAFTMSRRFGHALTAANRALELAPDFTEVRILRALSLRELGRLAEAQEDLDVSLAADPGNLGALHSMAATKRDLGQLDEALDLISKEIAAKEVLAQDARSMSHSRVDRARLYQRLRRIEEARVDLDRACELDPSNPEAWSARGEFHSLQGEHELAIADFKHLTGLDPSEPSSWNDLGSALSGAGRPGDAVKALDRALSLRPQYSAARVNRGVALSLSGRQAEARDEWTAAIADDPTNAYPHMNLALSLKDSPETMPQALSHARTAADLRPDLSEAQGILGALLLESEEPREAAAVLAEAARLDPWTPPAIYNLALAQAHFDHDAAMASLALFLSRFPDEVGRARSDSGFDALRSSDRHRDLFMRMVG